MKCNTVNKTDKDKLISRLKAENTKLKKKVAELEAKYCFLHIKAKSKCPDIWDDLNPPISGVPGLAKSAR